MNVDRDTPLLLPYDLHEWVADNDLAQFVLEAVSATDLRCARVNERVTGSAQYPPSMMLALLIYCYATGVFSSRRIERATYDSVSVRYLCTNEHPDRQQLRPNLEALAPDHPREREKCYKQRLIRRLKTTRGKALYRKRNSIAEGAFGLIKNVIGFDRF